MKYFKIPAKVVSAVLKIDARIDFDVSRNQPFVKEEEEKIEHQTLDFSPTGDLRFDEAKHGVSIIASPHGKVICYGIAALTTENPGRGKKLTDHQKWVRAELAKVLRKYSGSEAIEIHLED